MGNPSQPFSLKLRNALHRAIGIFSANGSKDSLAATPEVGFSPLLPAVEAKRPPRTAFFEDVESASTSAGTSRGTELGSCFASSAGSSREVRLEHHVEYGPEVLIHIAGCGHEEFNGNYLWDGHFDDHMAFRKAKRGQVKPQKQTLNWNADRSAWYLCEDHKGYWYKAKSTGTEWPPPSGWTVNPRRLGPAPKVTIVGNVKAPRLSAQESLYNAIDRQSTGCVHRGDWAAALQDKEIREEMSKMLNCALMCADTTNTDLLALATKSALMPFFDVIDLNRDKVITREEFVAGIQIAPGIPRRKVATPIARPKAKRWQRVDGGAKGDVMSLYALSQNGVSETNIPQASDDAIETEEDDASMALEEAIIPMASKPPRRTWFRRHGDRERKKAFARKSVFDVLFDAIDSNSDGAISQKEFAAAVADTAYRDDRLVLLTSVLREYGVEATQEAFSHCDMVCWLFDSLDKNRDGVIDRKEFVHAMRAGSTPFFQSEIV